MNQKTTIYFPDRSIKQGYISLLKEMFVEVHSSWWLTFQLFKRNFSATYKQSILGVFWALFVPLVSVGTFIFLNSGGVIDVGVINVPYPLFAVAGTAFWQILSLGLTLGANSLVNAGAMISKLNFTRESLVIAAVAQGFVPCLLQVVVVFILMAVYQIIPPLTVLLIPFMLIPLLLLTLGLGFVFSLINGVMRDVGNGISIIFTFLMFVTPVLYARPASGIVAVVTRYNPFYYLIAVPRDLFILGNSSDLRGYAYSAVFAVVVFIVCWVAFHLTENRITERV